MLRGFAVLLGCWMFGQELRFSEVLLFVNLLCKMPVSDRSKITYFALIFFKWNTPLILLNAMRVEVRTWFEIKLDMNLPSFNYYCIFIPYYFIVGRTLKWEQLMFPKITVNHIFPPCSPSVCCSSKYCVTSWSGKHWFVAVTIKRSWSVCGSLATLFTTISRM